MTNRVGLSRAHALLGAFLLGLLVHCTNVGEFVWVDSYRDALARSRAPYVISPGDLIAVRVWNQEAMSARVRVRIDGMVSLPLLNDIEAAGLEPPTLAKRLEVKLKDFIVNPLVTVALEEPAPLEISIVGEVDRPGVYRVDQDVGVLNAIASASGLTRYAHRDRIFVLRRVAGSQDAAPTRIRFTYDALSRVEGVAAKFRLRRGDVIVVE